MANGLLRRFSLGRAWIPPKAGTAGITGDLPAGDLPAGDLPAGDLPAVPVCRTIQDVAQPQEERGPVRLGGSRG